MNNYYNPILEQIRTTSDAEALVSQIDQVLQDIYKTTSASILDVIDTSISSTVGQEIKEAFHTHGLSWEHHEEVKSFFLGLKESLSQCAVITLTLAYHPTDKQIKRLKNWTIRNLPGNNIFEIEYDESIIGGAIIVMNGRYLDLSLKTKIDSYFINQAKVVNSN